MTLKINIFKNKKTKENQPDYRGNVKDDLGEIILEAAGWVKKTKAGDDFISLQLKKVKPKTEEEINMPSYDDGLPF